MLPLGNKKKTNFDCRYTTITLLLNQKYETSLSERESTRHVLDHFSKHLNFTEYLFLYRIFPFQDAT